MRNKKELEVRLNNIWVGSHRLRINIPRFQCNQQNAHFQHHLKPRLVGHTQQVVRKGISYAAVVKKDNINNLNKRLSRGTNRMGNTNAIRANDWNGLEFNVNNDELKWLKRSYVGQTHKIEAVVITQDKFHQEGIFVIKAAPMGGDLVLLTPMGDEEVSEILAQDEVWPSKWFNDIKPWSPEMVAKERNVWLSVTGLPPYAWKEEIFNTPVQMMGKFITLDDRPTSFLSHSEESEYEADSFLQVPDTDLSGGGGASHGR